MVLIHDDQTMEARSRAYGAGRDRAADRARNTRALAVTLVLVTAYMVAEIVGGILANSLALLADAGHMLADAGALGLTLFALWFTRRPATAKHTYGFRSRSSSKRTGASAPRRTCVPD
jgi:cobalt-zinc-cadmium efflux system protein